MMTMAPADAMTAMMAVAMMIADPQMHAGANTADMHAHAYVGVRSGCTQQTQYEDRSR